MGDCPLIEDCEEKIGFKFFTNYCTDHFDWCPTYEEKTKLRKPREWLEFKEKESNRR